MNGYIAIYRSKKIEITSDSIYHAQQAAAKEFGVGSGKSYVISVALAEKDGKPVVHIADF